jgi:hypothetical protein
MSRFIGIAILITHAAAACVHTGFVLGGIDLTATLINPGSLPAEIDASGCHIGVFFSSGKHRVDSVEIHGANYFGIAVVSTSSVSVDISSSFIHDIGESPINGMQHGVAVYYRGFGGSASGSIRDTTITAYQKGGIVLHGAGASVRISGNVVSGLGPTGVIGQNGIEIAWGADAMVDGNYVGGNRFTGSSTVASGILVIGGPAFACPAAPCSYTTGTRIMRNRVVDNDIGVYLSNLDAEFNLPATASNIKVVGNSIARSDALGNAFQAGIAVLGDRDGIVANLITGYPIAIDADPALTRVEANQMR